MLKKGKLVEVGNHDSLLRDFPDGVYSKFVKQQQDAENRNEEGPVDIDDVDFDVDEVDGNIDININMAMQYTTGRMR